MNSLVQFLRENPWLLLWILCSAFIVVAGLVVLIRSPKFLRKWRWFFLSLLSISYQHSVAPGVLIVIGAPIGALIVLWHWRFGRSPTPEAVAAHAKAVELRNISYTRSNALLALRAAYSAAAVGAFALAAFMYSVGVDAFLQLAEPMPPALERFLPIVKVFQLCGLGVVGVILGFLAFRPYWWGKILCAWAGFAWSGFGAVATFVFNTPQLGWVSAAGLLLLGTGIAHQLIDPRFGGSHLRLGPPIRD